MPSRSTVERFVQAVSSGRQLDAIANFYHRDASVQENEDLPVSGRDALISKERAAQAKVRSVRTHLGRPIVVDGDQVVINWIFEIVDGSGVTRRLDELAFQTWRGDRIQQERFYYDTASAWRPAAG